MQNGMSLEGHEQGRTTTTTATSYPRTANQLFGRLLELNDKKRRICRSDVEEAEDILQEMEERYRQNPSRRKMQPQPYSYNLVLNSWSILRDPVAAELLLRRMPTSMITTVAYTAVISAWSKTSDGAPKAQQLLDEMISLYQDGNDRVKPNTHAYTAVITAWSKSKLPEAAAKGLSLFEDMKKGDKDMQPNNISYSAIISLLSRNKDYFDKTKELLDELNKRYKQDASEGLRPDTVVYSSAIMAYARSNQPQQAQELLDDMKAQYEAGNVHVKPNRVTYTAVMAAWCDQPNGTAKAEAILGEMWRQGREVEPDVVAYNILIDGFAKHKGGKRVAWKRALQYVREMHRLAKAGNYRVRPDSITYTTLISVMGRSGSAQATAWAFKLFGEMKRRYKDGDEGLKPSAHSYSAIITALSRTSDQKNDAPRLAQSLLDELKQLSEDNPEDVSMRPNAITYTAVMTAWVRSNHPDAPIQAQALLQEMRSRYNREGDEEIRPGTISYNMVMAAWSRSSDARAHQRVLEILQEMKHRYQNGDRVVRPDEISYSIAISKVSEQPGQEAKESAAALMKEMTEWCKDQ